VLVIAYSFPAELEFLLFFGALKAVAPDFPGLPDDPLRSSSKSPTSGSCASG
jgi:hypothetical protein